VNSPNSQEPERGGRGAPQGGESEATGPAEDSVPAAPRLSLGFGKLHPMNAPAAPRLSQGFGKLQPTNAPAAPRLSQGFGKPQPAYDEQRS